MSIVITGASGQLGQATARFLLQQVDPQDVVLLSRNPDALSAHGAEARFADFGDPASLDAAFAGAERVLIISTDAVGRRIEHHQNAIDAAVRAGARHLVYTSVPNPTDANPAGVVDDHATTEQALRDSGLAWTSLRNALYMDFLAGELETARAHGTLAHNEGDGRATRVTREDCAAVAAAVLADPGPHANTALDVTGSQLITAAERAAIYADIIGSPVEAQDLDDDAFVDLLTSTGMPEQGARLYASFGEAIRVGALDQQSDVVQRLTGRPPTTIEGLLG